MMSNITLSSTVKIDSFNNLFYKDYAALDNQFKFTPKELDVIACLINGKNVKAIAQILEIAGRTVESHIRNIMLKIGCNSREGIINCIEKSNQYHFVKYHYPKIQLRRLFNQSLLILREAFSKNHQLGIIDINITQPDHGNLFITQFIKDLNFVSIQTNINTHLPDPKQDHGYGIWISRKAISISSDADVEVNDSHDHLYITLNHDTVTIKQFSFDDFIDSNGQVIIQYFNLIMNILNELFQTAVVKDCIKDFQQQCLKLMPLQQMDNYNNPVAITNLKITQPSRKLPTFKIGLFLLSFTIIGMVVYLQNVLSCKYIPQYLPFKSHTSQLLERPYLLQQIAMSLDSSDNIETVIISGLGGAGKTTLARQYADAQDRKVIWEINAENTQLMLSSFDKLAHSIATDDTDRKLLNEIAIIKNFQDKNDQLLNFVRSKLKKAGNWLLIYDNVSHFDDIKTFYPDDNNLWGSGHVIITTQNSTLSCHPKFRKIIHLAELTADEKYQLYTKAAGIEPNQLQRSKDQRDITEFLKSIPAFPLDVSLAAYYIRSTHTPYHKYLEHFKQNCDYFNEMQYEFFSQNQSYHKTRYSMIALTVKALMAKNQNFGDMLLLISLLDSQNIARELLEHYQNDLSVSNFIYQLKKFSLLSDQKSTKEHHVKSIDLHRHIQQLLLSYLMNTNNPADQSKKLEKCYLDFNAYVDKKIAAKDFIQLHYLRPHYEKLTGHLDALGFSEILGFKNQLGIIYYYLSLTEQSINQLTQLLNKMTAAQSQDHARLAEVLQYLGMAYTERGEYKTAESYLKQNLSMNQRYFPKDFLDIARTQALLGHIYGGLKQYQKAKGYLEQSLEIYAQHFRHDHIERAVALKYLSTILRGTGDYGGAKNMLEKSLAIYQKTDDQLGIATLLAHLGNLTREMGDFEQSSALLERSLRLYQDVLPSNHTDIAWVMGHLGKVYLLRRDFNQAYATLEKSLSIYHEKYPPDHDYIAWITSYLGMYYGEIGQHERAQQLLLKAIGICGHNNGKSHLDTARMYRELARVYYYQHQLDQAEKTIKQALKVFEDHHHPELYVAVEYLGDILVKKLEATVNSAVRKQLVTECSQLYARALQSTEQYFPANSIHVKTLKLKLQKIQAVNL